MAKRKSKSILDGGTESTKLTQQQKSKFRASKEWKEFREKKMEECGKICAFCGAKLTSKQATLHHKFIAKTITEYKDLNRKDGFTILCHQCHRSLHNFARKKNKTKELVELKKLIAPILGDEWANEKGDLSLLD